VKIKGRVRKVLGIDIRWKKEDEKLNFLEKEFSERKNNFMIEEIEEKNC